jgi:hypothetical protein
MSELKPIFGRKHYSAIADIIKVCKNKTINGQDQNYRKGVEYLEAHIIVAFEIDNPAFDRIKFINKINNENL